jgi:predicted RecA/RadA family phage recombinase
MDNFLSEGHVMTLTAPSGGVVGGVAYKIGQLLVVAAATVAQTLPFEGKTTGVFTLPKDETESLTEGALVYWVEGADEITTTATGNVLVGVAALDAGGADPTCVIRLDGVARPDEP